MAHFPWSRQTTSVPDSTQCMHSITRSSRNSYPKMAVPSQSHLVQPSSQGMLKPEIEYLTLLMVAELTILTRDLRQLDIRSNV
eukprot:2837328-Rhodomonas_salina.1